MAAATIRVAALKSDNPGYNSECARFYRECHIIVCYLHVHVRVLLDIVYSVSLYGI